MFVRSPQRALTITVLALLAAAPVARADFRLERELALGPEGTFRLESAAGSIEIRGTDRSGVRLVATASRDDVEERYSFSFAERGGDAIVKVERRGGWTRRILGGDDKLRFQIQVPRGANVDLSTAGGAIDAATIQGRVGLRSSGGSIDVADIDGDVDAHTSGGPVRATGVRGNARLDTSGGAIEARGVTGDLVAHTSGGSIDVEDAGGAVKAHTSGGPVQIAFASGNASGGDLSSSGGGVTAIVDPTVALELDIHTSGGRAIVDLPVTTRGSMSRNTVRGTLNGGGQLLKLRSSGGSVRVRGL